MIHQSFVPASARRVVGAAFIGLSAAACAASTGATVASSATSPAENATKAAPTSSRYILVQADLEKAKADNAYDAITKLRPDFLRGRNENTSFVQQSINGGSKDTGGAPASSSTGTATVKSVAPIMVYKDNVRLGGVDDLRQMQLSTIREIRFLPGPDAVIRFGSNHSAGAILITSK